MKCFTVMKFPRSIKQIIYPPHTRMEKFKSRVKLLFSFIFKPRTLKGVRP